MATISSPKIDLDLVLKAQAGDGAAFGELYDIYIKPIYNFVFYKTLVKETAEDITSIVFTKAWQKIGQFQGESVAAWLYAIARNAVADYYRSEKNNLDIEDFWDLAASDNFLEKVDLNLATLEIKKALSRLSVREREIIIMRFWLDMPFKEIAASLNKQEGAVKMSLSRALKNVKNQLPLALIILGPNIINICQTKN
ncbi:MAG: sigma-70 family RNA polymerase sigma factor [Candidatus Falkowbacteria bacterium]|nr:MAG: sigma-70 family RNA polymerase sigma factor [Candidatus Falkowbacteria bacterium]